MEIHKCCCLFKGVYVSISFQFNFDKSTPLSSVKITMVFKEHLQLVPDKDFPADNENSYAIPLERHKKEKVNN